MDVWVTILSRITYVTYYVISFLEPEVTTSTREWSWGACALQHLYPD